jgi:hypothetical protein
MSYTLVEGPIPDVDVFALITSMKERDVRILKIFKVATICIQTRGYGYTKFCIYEVLQTS